MKTDPDKRRTPDLKQAFLIIDVIGMMTDDHFT